MSAEIRAIVREEISKALNVLARSANRYPDYDTDTIENTAAYMLEEVSERAARMVTHAEGCPTRSRWLDDCECEATS